MPEKNPEVEQPIPYEWRSTLAKIVDDIRSNSLQSECRSESRYYASKEDIDLIHKNIDAYGGTLAPLPEYTWQTSVCRWMGQAWSVLVDLFSVEEGESDLVMFVDVCESDNSYQFKVKSVHVP